MNCIAKNNKKFHRYSKRYPHFNVLVAILDDPDPQKYQSSTHTLIILFIKQLLTFGRQKSRTYPKLLHAQSTARKTPTNLFMPARMAPSICVMNGNVLRSPKVPLFTATKNWPQPSRLRSVKYLWLLTILNTRQTAIILRAGIISPCARGTSAIQTVPCRQYLWLNSAKWRLCLLTFTTGTMFLTNFNSRGSTTARTSSLASMATHFPCSIPSRGPSTHTESTKAWAVLKMCTGMKYPWARCWTRSAPTWRWATVMWPLSQQQTR